MAKYFEERSEARRNMSKEEKLAIKEEKDRQIEEFGWAEVGVCPSLGPGPSVNGHSCALPSLCQLWATG
jgi:hypothetical protein